MQYIFTIDHFFSTIGDDFSLLKNIFFSNEEDKKAQKDSSFRKVAEAVVQIFAAFMMAVGVCFTILSFKAMISLGALFQMAVGIAIYALSHDVFKIIQNVSEYKKTLKAEGEGIAQGIKTGFTGTFKNISDNLSKANDGIDAIKGIYQGAKEGIGNAMVEAEKSRLAVYTEGTLVISRLLKIQCIWDFFNARVEEWSKQN